MDFPWLKGASNADSNSDATTRDNDPGAEARGEDNVENPMARSTRAAAARAAQNLRESSGSPEVSYRRIFRFSALITLLSAAYGQLTLFVSMTSVPSGSTNE